MANLKEFINPNQLQIMHMNEKGEEGQFFTDKLASLSNMIDNMAATGETDGKGDEAIVVLHYFIANFHWFITEKDTVDGEPQYQAFGFADMGFPELGYINIDELINNNVELDLYFEPRKLGQAKKDYGY